MPIRNIHLRARLRGILAAAILIVAWPTLAKADGCGPFGNAPATLTTTPSYAIPIFGGLDIISSDPAVPTCDAGQLMGPWNDSDGSPRYSCLYESSNASASNPLPLIVYLHGSLKNADSVATTNLLSSAGGTDPLDTLNNTNLTDKSSTPGFILLAPQGRDTVHIGYNAFDAQGLGWDNWYRQFSADDVTVGGTIYPENVDAAAIDHFIDQETATRESRSQPDLFSRLVQRRIDGLPIWHQPQGHRRNRSVLCPRPLVVRVRSLPPNPSGRASHPQPRLAGTEYGSSELSRSQFLVTLREAVQTGHC